MPWARAYTWRLCCLCLRHALRACVFCCPVSAAVSGPYDLQWALRGTAAVAERWPWLWPLLPSKARRSPRLGHGPGQHRIQEATGVVQLYLTFHFAFLILGAFLFHHNRLQSGVQWYKIPISVLHNFA